MMDTNEIDEICLKDDDIRPYFMGTVAADGLPEKLPPYSMFCLNLQASHLPGNHWTTLNIDIEKPGTVIYFDSFGRKPPMHIRDYFTLHKRQIIYNDSQVQSPFSESCAAISIVVMKLWAHHYPTLEIIHRFLPNPWTQPFISEGLSENVISLLTGKKPGQIMPPFENE